MLEKWDAAVQDCENAVRRAGREQEAQQLLDKAKRMKHKSEQKDYYGKLPRYRWHLGCILLKVAAISLLTGILGVPADAKDKAIKKAYHKLSYAAYLLVSGRTLPISTL